MKKTKKEELFKKTEKFFNNLMVPVLILLLIVIILPEIIELDQYWLRVFFILDFSIWIFFVVELGILTILSDKKIEYLKKNWLNLIIIFLPLLNLFGALHIAEILRLTKEAKIISLLRIPPAIGLLNRDLKSFFLKHKLNYLLLFTIASLLFIGILGSFFEREHPDANILTTADGIWWAFTSIATVGYGDTYPVTGIGKLLSVVLITVGFATFSLFTASIASHFIDKDSKKEERRLNRKINELDESLDSLERKIDKLVKKID